MSSYPSSRLSPILRILLFAGYPVLAIKSFTFLSGAKPSTPEMVILIVMAVFLAMASASFLRNSGQFFRALFERLRYVLGLLLYLFYIALNLVRIVFYIATRSFFWIIILVVYWVSPVDLVPDPLLPFGVLDDATITLIAVKWGMRRMNREMGRELNWRARAALEATRIETLFP